MIISAAILSKTGEVYLADFIPEQIAKDVRNYANAFLFSMNREGNGIELPYVETTYSRFVFRETGDLYWVLVTKTESDLESDIDLMGKFVCTIMEYGSSETTSVTLTDEQKDLFYRHIWRAWDENPQCLFCGRHNSAEKVWERDFESRVRFLASVRDGQVDEQDVLYFNELIEHSWFISAKLSLEQSNQSICSNETVSEEAVVDGCRLVCLLEDIRIVLKRIQDPYMRLFARRDLLKESVSARDDDKYYNTSLNKNNNNNNNSVDDSFDDSSFSH